MHLRWTAQSRVFRMTERSLWLGKSQLFHHLDLNSSVWLVFSAPPNPGTALIWHPAVRHTRYYPQENVTLKRICLIAGWSHPTPPVLPSALTSLLFSLPLQVSWVFSGCICCLDTEPRCSATWLASPIQRISRMYEDELTLCCQKSLIIELRCSSHTHHWQVLKIQLRGRKYPKTNNCECIVKRKSLRPPGLSLSIRGPSCSSESHTIDTSLPLSLAFLAD